MMNEMETEKLANCHEMPKAALAFVPLVLYLQKPIMKSSETQKPVRARKSGASDDARQMDKKG